MLQWQNRSYRGRVCGDLVPPVPSWARALAAAPTPSRGVGGFRIQPLGLGVASSLQDPLPHHLPCRGPGLQRWGLGVPATCGCWRATSPPPPLHGLQRVLSHPGAPESPCRHGQPHPNEKREGRQSRAPRWDRPRLLGSCRLGESPPPPNPREPRRPPQGRGLARPPSRQVPSLAGPCDRRLLGPLAGSASLCGTGQHLGARAGSGEG